MSDTTPPPPGGGFGELLRIRRLHAGLSQERLAQRSGLSQRTIRKIESGRSAPRASTLNLLADALGLASGDRTAFFAAALPGNPAPTGQAVEPPVAPAPAQLPAATSLFRGRRTERDRLLALARPGRVVTVSGMAGVGKSSLTVHVARSLAAEYPDGQLFLDLCGFSATRPPVDPADALDRLLRALDVPGGRIPTHLDDRAALFRGTLAGRRVLLLLDNAADVEQLRPLLPGDSPATVLVTSRNTLAGIHDADHVRLAPLDVEAAVLLLAEAMGDPALVDSDRPTLVDIVELCGLLPLAIRVAAAKLRTRPQWSPADLLRRMRRPRYVLTAGEDSLGAAFDTTYRGLTEARRRLFRLSGTIPVSHFDAYTAAALVNANLADVEDDLESLVDAHLLETDGPGRYHFHDLLRDYAAHTARLSDDESARSAALNRVLARFRTTATAAARQLAPHYHEGVPILADPATFATPDIDDQREAVAWFSAEIHHALALIAEADSRRMDRAANDLAVMVRSFLVYHAHHDEMLRLARRGITLALRLDDREAQAHWLLAEGDALEKSGRASQAKAPEQRALRLYEESGNLSAQAVTLNALGPNPTHPRRCAAKQRRCRRGTEVASTHRTVHTGESGAGGARIRVQRDGPRLSGTRPDRCGPRPLRAGLGDRSGPSPGESAG